MFRAGHEWKLPATHCGRQRQKWLILHGAILGCTFTTGPEKFAATYWLVKNEIKDGQEVSEIMEQKWQFKHIKMIQDECCYPWDRHVFASNTHMNPRTSSLPMVSPAWWNAGGFLGKKGEGLRTDGPRTRMLKTKYQAFRINTLLTLVHQHSYLWKFIVDLCWFTFSILFFYLVLVYRSVYFLECYCGCVLTPRYRFLEHTLT